MFVYDRKSNRKIDMDHNLKYDRISDWKSYCKSDR